MAGPAAIRWAASPGSDGWLAGLIAGNADLDTQLLHWVVTGRYITFRVLALTIVGATVLGAVRWVRRTPPGAPPAGGLPRAAPLWIAAWFGLVSGVGEGLHIAGQTMLLARPAPWDWTTNGNTALLAPIAQAGVYLAIGMGIVLAARLRPGPRAVRFAILWFALLTAMGWVLVTRVVHPAAGLALAVGAGVQTVRVIVPRLAAFLPAIRRGTLRLAALVGVLLLARPLWIAVRIGLDSAGAPPPAGASVNVLMLMLDTQRASSMRLYGAPLPGDSTVIALAESGILFENAVAPSSWTLPSHASLFTGKPAHALGVIEGEPLDPRYVTLAEVLHSRGYFTTGVAGNLYYLNRSYGLAQGFVEWTGTPLDLRALAVASSWVLLGRKAVRDQTAGHTYMILEGADRLHRRLLRSLDRRPPGRPFFAFVNYFDVHEPYEARPGYVAGPLIPGQPTWLEVDSTVVLDSASVRSWRTAYESESAWLEDRIGTLLDSLAARGLLDNTLVVLTADHGEHFGEHGLVEHSNSLYRAITGVPLVFRLPGGEEGGVRVATPVAIADVGATVLDVLGFRTDAFPGASLAPLWRPGSAEARPVVASMDEIFSVIHDGHRYIAHADGRTELYALADTAELHDLASSPDHAAILQRLRTIARQAGAPGLPPR